MKKLFFFIFWTMTLMNISKAAFAQDYKCVPADAMSEYDYYKLRIAKNQKTAVIKTTRQVGDKLLLKAASTLKLVATSNHGTKFYEGDSNTAEKIDDSNVYFTGELTIYNLIIVTWAPPTLMEFNRIYTCQQI